MVQQSWESPRDFFRRGSLRSHSCNLNVGSAQSAQIAEQDWSRYYRGTSLIRNTHPPRITISKWEVPKVPGYPGKIFSDRKCQSIFGKS